VLGCVTWRSMPWIARRFDDPGTGFWVALTLHGAAGLVIIEWGFMEHRPGNIPDHLLDAIAQVGMFAWWCTIAAMPQVIVSEQAEASRRTILGIYGVYALTSTVLALRWGIAPVILMMPPVYVAFFWFYWRQARALRLAQAAPAIVPGDDMTTGWRR
jgi:hypothetical protein